MDIQCPPVHTEVKNFDTTTAHMSKSSYCISDARSSFDWIGGKSQETSDDGNNEAEDQPGGEERQIMTMESR